MVRRLLTMFIVAAALIVSSWIYPARPGKKFLVTGSIMQTVSYCGGAQPPQQMLDSLNTPKPIPYGKLFVKSGDTNIDGARVKYRINADAKGNFSIYLPAGNYCLVEEWKSLPFKLPPNDSKHKVDSACFKNLYNSCDFALHVSDKSDRHVKIVFHRACPYNQPCISYNGPLPPVSQPPRH